MVSALNSDNPSSAEDIGTCKETAHYTIDECPCTAFVPNVFTPNGDGINEVFKPEISCFKTLKEYKMLIYNRLGKLIFRTSDYLTGWDGKSSKGKDCPVDVYYCVIEYTDANNHSVYRHTSVTLFM